MNHCCNDYVYILLIFLAGVWREEFQQRQLEVEEVKHVEILSRNSGLNGGQSKSCFGKLRAKSDAVSWTKFPMLCKPCVNPGPATQRR